ncbi:MAG: hydroxymethylglutaryl-CoA reductase [Bernardetiaceae bacterium]
MKIPSLVLKQLYNRGSLENTEDGIQFSIKNRLSDAQLTEMLSIRIDDREIPREQLRFDLGNGTVISGDQVSADAPVDFPLRKVLKVSAPIGNLPDSKKHKIQIEVKSDPFGKLKFSVEDAISVADKDMVRIPRDENDDYSPDAIKMRQLFTKQITGKELQHVPNYSFDPHITHGNCEHFVGVAQVPMGIAGPLQVNGEYAKGEFLIPMATAEGTLVASYNRGMKLLNLCGGAICTVVEDAMQRAPVFIFENARGARDFVSWIKANTPKIAEEAESTTSVGKLSYIDPYLASKFAYLRFNFKTGDAAGQNMVGRATFAACSWILDNYKENRITNFYLESNLATDKKASQVNVMHTRGKRVTAECVIKRDILIQTMRVDPQQLAYHAQVANVGAILSGANNNGLHSANGITAMFIATGQDVANVSESSAGILHTELTPEGDMYISITIPSLIVATYGGGTGLATQRECLEMMDCYGRDRVYKFAEIVAAVVLAGELSLASAISSADWVSSHEQYGRNR